MGLGSSPVMESGMSTSGKVRRWRSIQSRLNSAPRENTAAISAMVKADQASSGVVHACQGKRVPSGSPSQNQLVASGEGVSQVGM